MCGKVKNLHICKYLEESKKLLENSEKMKKKAISQSNSPSKQDLYITVDSKASVSAIIHSNFHTLSLPSKTNTPLTYFSTKSSAKNPFSAFTSKSALPNPTKYNSA
jgi:hypothetical protein